MLAIEDRNLATGPDGWVSDFCQYGYMVIVVVQTRRMEENVERAICTPRRETESHEIDEAYDVSDSRG